VPGDFDGLAALARATIVVLDWLKANARGYQTRINRILRAAMETQPPRRTRPTTPVPKKNARTRHASRPA